MQIAAGIHWLAYTMPEFGKSPIPWRIRNEIKPTPAGGIPGYEYGEKYAYDIRLHWSSREIQGQHVIMSGTTIEELRQDGYNMRHWLGDMLALPARPSRLDVAVDVVDSGWTATDAYEWYKSGKCSTRLKGHGYYYRQNAAGVGGATLYVGDRGSKSGFIRIYDKAVEQGTGQPGDWTRIELQAMRRRAPSIAAALAGTEDDAEYRKLMVAIVGGVAAFDTDEWREIFTKEVKVPQKREVKNNRRDWLLTTVAKSISNQIEEGDYSILRDIEREVMKNILDNMKSMR
jgi:hypothetical protein